MARLLVLSNSVKGSKKIKKKRRNKFQTRKLKKKNGKVYTKKITIRIPKLEQRGIMT